MDGLETRVANMLARRWWLVLLRGLAAIAFGVLTWLRPDVSLATLILFFGTYTIDDGVLAMWSAIDAQSGNDQWWMLLGGLVSITVGMLALFVAPGLTALGLLLYIAAWAVARGVLEIVVALRLRDEIHGEWRFILAAVASVVFGALLLARPGAGVLAVLWLIGTYAVGFGILLVLFAFKARGFSRQLRQA